MADVKSSSNINTSNINTSTVKLNPAPSGPIPSGDKEEEKSKEKEEEIKIDTSKVEPEEEELENPIRILPLQRKVIEELKTNDFEPFIHGRYSGFVMLKRKRPDVVSVYDEEEVKKEEEKKPEEKKPEEKKEDNNNNANEEGYKSLPQEDFDIPEDFDVDKAK